MTSTSPCVLGMDIGTSSLKCVVLGEDGTLRASAAEAYPTASPHTGWVEQDPADWYAAARRALAEIANQDPSALADIRCIGICSAAHIPVLLDENSQVIRPAILWADQRSGDEVAFLARNHGDLLRGTALNDAGCTWTLPQLMWLRRHEPENFQRARILLSSKDYLIYRICGRFVMDTGSGAATLMLDAQRRTWSEDLAALSGLPLAALPPIHAAFDRVGTVTETAAQDLGLPKGVPILAGCLDSGAELLGCGILGPEDGGMIRVGSSGGVMGLEPRPSCSGGIITYPFPADGQYYKQAGTNSCATSLRWMKGMFSFLGEEVERRITYELFDELAATVTPGADGLLFHPFLQGERTPYWNPDLRGSFTGIALSHGWPHFVRAVMEGVAFSLKDCLALFAREGFGMDRAVMAGGIAKSPVWSQIIADVLGIELHTIRQGDSAFGAALMATVGGGLFGDLTEAVRACVRPDRTITPNAANAVIYAEMFQAYEETAAFFNSRAAPSPVEAHAAGIGADGQQVG